MVAFQRDDLHRETTRLLANGLVQTKNYNDVGLLSSQIIRPEQETTDRLQFQAERHYHYDNNYLLTQVDDSRLGKLNYQYDPIGRLIKSQNPYKTESFSFDPAGNLIDPIATQAAQVKNNLISQYQGKHYKYDAQGNVIETTQAGQTLKLTWDNLNRLIQSDNNGQITNYGYDVFGRRLFKNNQTDHSLTLFGWDGDLMIWESYQANQTQSKQQDYTKHYVYEPNSFVPLLQTGYAGFIQLIETPDYRQFQNVPYSIYKDPVWKTETRKNKAELERVAFYHCDQVGTPQTLSNELGECVWEIKQNIWGTALEINTSDNLLEQTNLRFQGQYYDKETGLHYNRYRYYEPYSARYVSKDPIGLFGGLNNSVYVSDPNQWIDPMGLQNQKHKNADDYNKAKGLMIASEERALKASLKMIEEAKTKKERIDKSLREESLKKAKEEAEKKARQNLTYNPSGLGRDRELDNINRVNKCTVNQTCTIDYITLGGGLGPWSTSASINTHNGDIFFSPVNISPKSGGDLVLALGDLALKGTPLGLSNSLSASLMLGRMQNIEGTSRSKATSSFLEGEAFTLSSTPYKVIPASAAVTVSGADLKNNPSQIFNKPYAKEGGFIFNGSILDLNRSNSYKVK